MISSLLAIAFTVFWISNVASEDLKCNLCWAALNEIEGLLGEGATQQEIENVLDQRVCSRFKSPLCNDLIKYGLPFLSQMLDRTYHVGAVCQELGLCRAPDFNHPDMVPIDKYVVDLDLPPQQRWTKLFQIPKYRDGVNALLKAVQDFLPVFVETSLSQLGQVVLSALDSEYQGELHGMAAALGADVHLLALAQVAYDATDGCTSIVADSPHAGHPLHVRNLDFGAGLGFTDTLRNLTLQVDFHRNGTLLFQSVGFAAYVGVLSGMRPNGWTATVDTRFLSANPLRMLLAELEELQRYKQTAIMPTHLLRTALTTQADYASALHVLQTSHIVASIYYIVGGTRPGQGVVLARDQNSVANACRIGDITPAWAVVQTNYDFWNKNASRFNPMPSPENPNVPLLDNRRAAALAGLGAIPPLAVGFDRLLNVLSTRPVLNQLSTYTIAMSAADNHFQVWGRYCNSPCPF